MTGQDTNKGNMLVFNPHSKGFLTFVLQRNFKDLKYDFQGFHEKNLCFFFKCSTTFDFNLKEKMAGLRFF